MKFRFADKRSKVNMIYGMSTVGLYSGIVFSMPWITSLWVGQQMRASFSPTVEHPHRHFNSVDVGGALLFELAWVFMGLFGGIFGGIYTHSMWVALAGFAGLVPAFVQRATARY